MTFSTRDRRSTGSRNVDILPRIRHKTASRRSRKVKLLYTRKAELENDTFYNIQVQKNKRNKHMYLIAQNDTTKSKNDDYYIELSKKQATNVKKIFSNNYSSLVDSISIQSNKLVLLNPTYNPAPTSHPVNNTIG